MMSNTASVLESNGKTLLKDLRENNKLKVYILCKYPAKMKTKMIDSDKQELR